MSNNKNKRQEMTVAELIQQVKQAEIERQAELAAEQERKKEEAAKALAAQRAKQAQLRKANMENKPAHPVLRALGQLLLAALFAGLGIALLLFTNFVFFQPMKANNEVLAEQRLKNRMELSSLLSEVFPSMGVDDELSDPVLKALEKKKNSFRTESATVAGEIEALRRTDELVAELLSSTGYDKVEFYQIVKDAEATQICWDAINHTVSAIDAQIDALGVANMKQEIDMYKGTTTTVTREDENGETITETVTTGGLVPEAQAKKNELQKKYDELKGKLDALDAYLADVDGKITDMYSRLELDSKAYDVFAKMKAISEYVKQNPLENMYLKDTTEKLESFPGESREEDDILFIMKVEAETGIRMQTVNYGQDYQKTKLSNGMILCYEAYTIPYYATYQGMKNLIAYFNENDDFYASVYTLSMQYNPQNQTIQGNMIILHYYLLEEGAEYVPPVIGETIIPGIDGIFGDVTDNGKTDGKQSPYTVDDIKTWLGEGMTFEQVRDKLKSEGYPATELAWILKEEYKTPAEFQGFLDEYGEEGKEYDLDYVLALLECDLATLMDIYHAKEEEPEEDDTTQEGGENTSDDPSDDDPTEGGSENTPDAPEDDVTDQPASGKQSDYSAADVEKMLDDGKSLEEIRDQLKSEGYPAIELAWILKEKYNTRQEIGEFVILHGDMKYTTIESATELFECTEDELRAIY